MTGPARGAGVDPRSISVVVQGPVVGAPDAPYEQRHTLRCLDSVRRHLPGAEVILSTWPDADLTGLPFDRVVVSEDPGSAPYTDATIQPPVLWPGNRVVVSSAAGLRAATRPYAIKTRSDLIFADARCLRLVGRYPRRVPEWRVTRERVLSPAFFAVNPRLQRQYPFHPSDWWTFGLREDLLDMWDVPLAGPEVPEWFVDHPKPANDVEHRTLCRYYAEQWAWLSFLRKHEAEFGPVPFEHRADVNPEAMRISELSIANNLQIHELHELGLLAPKKSPDLRIWVWGEIYTRGDWERLYRQYCDPAFRPGPDLARLEYRAYQLLTEPGQLRGFTRLQRTWARVSPRTFEAASWRAAEARAEFVRDWRPR